MRAHCITADSVAVAVETPYRYIFGGVDTFILKKKKKAEVLTTARLTL